MMQLRSLFFTALLGFMLVTPAASQSTDVVGELSLHVLGGISSDPQGFDVLRETTFGSATVFGGGFTYVIYENVAVRGDFHYAPKTGREECCSAQAPGDGQGVTLPANPGAVSEDVDLNRYYYGASLLIRFPMSSAVPYLKLGGGFVDIRREAASYQYDFAEFGVQLGGGISIPMGADAPVSFFVDAVEWIYARTGSGEGSQMDTVISAGLSYAFIR